MPEDELVRTFEDAAGRRWDVAVSEESYGMLRLLFAARDGSELRAHALEVSSRGDAERILLALGETELLALLGAALAWQPG